MRSQILIAGDGYDDCSPRQISLARADGEPRRTFITLAQVDGARRDLLETMSHGPRPIGSFSNVDSEVAVTVIATRAP